MKKMKKNGGLFLFIMIMAIAVFAGSVTTNAASANLYRSSKGTTTPNKWKRAGEYTEHRAFDQTLKVTVKGKKPLKNIKLDFPTRKDVYIKSSNSGWKYSSSKGAYCLNYKLPKVENGGRVKISVMGDTGQRKTYTVTFGSAIREKALITSVKRVTDKSAKITWKKYTLPAADMKYMVYRASSLNGTYKKLSTVNGTAGSYTDKTVSLGKTYYYKVRACFNDTFGTSTYKKAYDAYSPASAAVKLKMPVLSTKNPAAMKAYKQFLEGVYMGGKMYLEGYGTITIQDVASSRFRFSDLNSDGVKELILYNDQTEPLFYYQCLFTYYNGAIKFLDWAKYVDYYKMSGSKKVFCIYEMRKGMEWYGYFTIKNGQMVSCNADYMKNMSTNSRTYTLSGKTVSRTKFNNYMKSNYGVTDATTVNTGVGQYTSPTLNWTNIDKYCK